MRRFVYNFIIGTFFSFGVLILLGTPSNSFGRVPELQNMRHWYFLNRGWPIPWSGTTLQDSSLSFPFVRLPYMTRVVGDVPMQKMVDVRIASVLYICLVIVSTFAFYLLLPVSLSQTIGLSLLLIVLDLIVYVRLFPQY